MPATRLISRHSARRRAGTFIASLLLVAGLAVPSQAQTSRWLELPPPPVSAGAFFYDAAHQRVILAGGAVGPVDQGSVWSLSLEGGLHWTLLSTEVAPIFQFGSKSVIFDPTRNRLVAFGSFAPLHAAEVCTFDLWGGPGSWTPLSTTPVTPALPGNACFAYDPLGDRMIAFGGSTGPSAYFNGLTALSFSGTPTWSTLTVPGTKPTGRSGGSAVFDPDGARMLYFGGFSRGTLFNPLPLDETWALSLTGPLAWTFLAPMAPVPPARGLHGAALDPAGRRMIVVGGADNSQRFNSAWQLDLDAPADSALWSPLPNFYQRRAHVAACVDTAGRRLLVYGGDAEIGTSTYIQPDLWSLSLDPPSSWSRLAGPAGTFRQRRSHASFVDPSREAMGITGGVATGTTMLTDTWVRALDDDQPGWSVIAGSSASDRANAVAVTDPTGDRALLFAGFTFNVPSDMFRNDLRSLNLAAPSAWTPLAPASPPDPRSGPLWVFDPTRRQAILYGGWGQYPNFRTKMFSDTWRFDAASDTWDLLAVGSFGGRGDMTGVYDPSGDRIIAFGGQDTLSFYNDVHVLPLGPGGVWATLATTGTPPPANGGSPKAFFDVVGQQLVVIAGLDAGSQAPIHMNAWSLSLTDPPTWSLLAPVGRPPTARGNFTAVMDEPRRRVVMMGGQSAFMYNDTWALYLDETTPATLSLQSVDATSDRVRIRWFGDGSIRQASAFKGSSDGAWWELGSLSADGTGSFTLEDRDVVPGGRYGYRLGVDDGGRMRYYGEATVEVPRHPALRLEGTRPSPTAGPLVISFALASDAPALLEVIDIQGRKVIDQEVGPLGVGVHQLRLERTEGLATGVYFLRLTQGSRSAVARAVVAR